MMSLNLSVFKFLQVYIIFFCSLSKKRNQQIDIFYHGNKKKHIQNVQLIVPISAMLKIRLIPTFQIVMVLKIFWSTSKYTLQSQEHMIWLYTVNSISMMGSQTISNLSDFEIIAKIGQGAFAEVYKVKRKGDGAYYAMKKIRMTRIKQKDRNHALTQIRILASERGENIIGYKEAFYDEPNNALCIVMEYAEKGDLLKLIQSHTKKRTKIDESEIWKALVHLSRGLKSLHDKKILHRDIKSANIFITNQGVYKIGDLNVSKVTKDEMAKTQTGTPYYASPQVWKDQPYGTKSDIWSLGCVLYEMAAKMPPFTGKDLQTLYKKISTGNFTRIPNQYSDELAQIISSLLKLNPNDRPSASSILNNKTVLTHFTSLQEERSQWQKDKLLQTIKFSHRNFKMINEVLPKANYQKLRSKTQGKNILKTDSQDENKNNNNFEEKDIVCPQIRGRVNTSHLVSENKRIVECLSKDIDCRRQRIISAYEQVNNISKSSLINSHLSSQIKESTIGNALLSQKISKKHQLISNRQKSPGFLNKNPPLSYSRKTEQKCSPLVSQKQVDNMVKNCLQIEDTLKGKQNLRRYGEQIMGSAHLRKGCMI